MPIGGFLDSLPGALFIAAHVLFLAVGVWAFRRVRQGRREDAPALWLYVASQPVFLLFFGGLLTLKMAVLLEQTLVVVMVGWIAAKARS